MKTRTAPDDPLVRRIQRWKKDQGIVSLSMGALKEQTRGQDIIIEQKVDGQSALMSWRAGQPAVFASLGGVVMWDLPVLDEIGKILESRGIRSAMMVGELAGYADGKIIPFNETMSLIKNPGSDKTKVHWFPYQILEMDGKEFGEGFETYMNTWPQIKRFFDRATYVHPVKSYGGADKLDEAWKVLVEEEKNEGLVIRSSGNKVYKVKPRFAYDLVVVAVGDKTAKNWPKGMIGTTLMAFMDKNGVFRTAGEIGTGWTEEQRREMFSWAQRNKVGEDDHNVWVKPQRVCEVVWERTTIKDMPAYRFSHGKYEPAGKMMSGTIVKPRFIRWRADKSANPFDLRLTQIPDWKEKEKEKMARNITARYLKEVSDAESC